MAVLMEMEMQVTPDQYDAVDAALDPPGNPRVRSSLRGPGFEPIVPQQPLPNTRQGSERSRRAVGRTNPTTDRSHPRRSNLTIIRGNTASVEQVASVIKISSLK